MNMVLRFMIIIFNIFITPVNRLIDLLGLGDSLLIVLEKNEK